MSRGKTAKMLAADIAESVSSLKAFDIKILNLSKLSSFTDFFVVCSGTSSRHVQSIADRVMEDQKKNGSQRLGIEGYEDGEWVLVDYGAVVAHVFHPEVRNFYNIEKFWGDAKRIKLRRE